MGVGAFGIERFADEAALLGAGPAQGPSLLQPFVDAVVAEGEWSFVFGAATRPMTPNAEDLEIAEACYSGLPVTAGLARIDMARLGNGRLALMEAELIEPQLFLFDVPEAAGLLAGAILEPCLSG